MRGELSFFEVEVQEESYRLSILRYEMKVVVRLVWSIPYELWFFEFNVYQMSCRSLNLRNARLIFVANFVLTTADNWLRDIKQWISTVINTTGVTYGAGTAYPTRELEFTHSFSGVHV